MTQLDALRLVEMTKERMVSLAVSENYLRDPTLADAAATIWNSGPDVGGLVSELWVQAAFPNELSNDSLSSLAAGGLFPAELGNYLDSCHQFPENRFLFSHQSQAVRQTARSDTHGRTSLVITAGTGAGKTEAFLLPVLSGLWSNRRKPDVRGMRCLILYPMNALVTDQVTRLYEWLKGQGTLSLFHFTSDTPEDDRHANRIGEPQWAACRRRTRQAARQGTPDIVITNYSMLEYMLCRPQDASFFGPALQYIILDEAHLYSGMLAAEITLLLRRMRDRCGVVPELVTHIATSATLGGTHEDLTKFASTIFSVPESSVSVIKGNTAEPKFDSKIDISSPTPDATQFALHAELNFATLTADGEFVSPDESKVAQVRQAIALILSESGVSEAAASACGNTARFLKQALAQSPLVRQLARLLYSHELMSVDGLAGELWGHVNESTRKSTILLLRMCAVARMNSGDPPIVPHRLHFLVRAPEGLSACLNPDCEGPTEFRVGGLGCLQSPQDRCSYCESVTLPVHRCDSCGQWALAGHETEAGEIGPGHFAAVSLRKYYLVANQGKNDLLEVIVDSRSGRYSGFRGKGTRLYKAPCPEHGSSCNDPDRCTQQMCPHCGSNWNSLDPDEDDTDRNLGIQPLRGAERVAVSVVAETVLFAMTVYPDASRDWKPANGRRLLCFSDSRREAARLGPLLSTQHETWVLRSAIVNTLARLKSPSPEYLKTQIRRYSEDLLDSSLAAEDRQESERRIRALNSQLFNATLGFSFGQFAEALAEDSRMQELLDRESGENQVAPWHQSTWVTNRSSVCRHAQALIARVLDNPVRKVISTEATGLVEVVYPGLETLELPEAFSGRLPSENLRNNLSGAWPAMLGTLLDSIRVDRGVDWSQETANRQWDGESPLFGRWMSRTKSGWKARSFIGKDDRRLDALQLRLWFACKVLKAGGCTEELILPVAVELLGAAFDQLCSGAGTTFVWLRTEVHEIERGESQPAIQILFDKINLRVPEFIYRCPDTGTLWPSLDYSRFYW